MNPGDRPNEPPRPEPRRAPPRRTSTHLLFQSNRPVAVFEPQLTELQRQVLDLVELNPPSADRSEPLLRRVIDDIKGRPGRGLGGKILPGRNTCHPSLEGDSR